MRIDIQSTIAVLFLAAILFPCSSLHSDQFILGQKPRRSGSRRENKFVEWSFSRSKGYEFEESEGRPWLTHRDNLMLLRQESGDEGAAVECCPTILDMIEPLGGKNLEDIYVELYSDGENRQRFYERSCRPDVTNKPCRFLDKKLYNQSRCVQKYSYTYALVRDKPTLLHDTDLLKARHHHGQPFTSKDWKMDYIRLDSRGNTLIRGLRPAVMKSFLRSRHLYNAATPISLPARGLEGRRRVNTSSPRVLLPAPRGQPFGPHPKRISLSSRDSF